MSSEQYFKAREEIKNLVLKYNNLVRDGKAQDYNEEDVKIKFIIPLLKALGWNIDTDLKAEKRTLRGITDFSLKIDTKKSPVIFYELKAFREDLNKGRTVAGKKQLYSMQVINAAFSARVDWCVLTNFKEIRLYYSKVRNPSEGLQFKLKFNEYITTKGFDKLWILSKEKISEGILET